MRLLDHRSFAAVFSPLVGHHVGVVDGFGNPGDRLLDRATRQLLTDWGITFQTVNPLADPRGSFDVDCLLLAGGGSMGGPRECQILRARALDYGLPCIVLPQSFHAPEDCRRFARVYVRETGSLSLHPSGTLAPDLALGYDFPTPPKPVYGKGVFQRRGGHAAFASSGRPDPADFCYTPDDYITFVSSYSHVVTDRLHLAITALGLGRRATLLPVTYHKNRSMWETWLRDLGCEWADAPE